MSRLQNLVLSEVSWLYTVIFYGLCLLVVYLVTATKRTAEARIWLYLILTVNIMIERLVCYLSLSNNEESAFVDASQLPETLYYRIWLVRKASLGSCVAVTVYMAFTFVDYNKVNNQLLLDIRAQNAELKKKMELVQVSSKGMTFDTSGVNKLDFTDGMSTMNPLSGKPSLDDTGGLADEESDYESSTSWDSADTDRTWREDTDNDQLHDSSFHGRNYDTKPETDDFFEHKMTMTDRMMENSPLASPKSVKVNSETLGAVSGKKVRRSNSRSSTPLPALESRYNLRSRSGNVSSVSEFQFLNPLLESETPDTFARVVKRMGNITKVRYGQDLPTAHINEACCFRSRGIRRKSRWPWDERRMHLQVMTEFDVYYLQIPNEISL